MRGSGLLVEPQKAESPLVVWLHGDVPRAFHGDSGHSDRCRRAAANRDRAAHALRDPHVLSSSSFYALYPGWTTLAMVGLSTMATVIASQALISGAFSMTQEAVQLGYLPRLRVLHTSSKQVGQIFIPAVNAMLACACIAVVLGFRSSDRLASAYGLAVTVTMLATSLAFGQVARLPVQMAVARRIRAQCALPQC